jgi:hypothetical protein
MALYVHELVVAGRTLGNKQSINIFQSQ